MTSSIALETMPLSDLLAAMQPLVAAMEKTKAQLAQVNRERQTAIRAADTERNAAIARAKTVKDAADAKFQAAVASATGTYESALQGVNRIVEAAETAHDEACSTAEPLVAEWKRRADQQIAGGR